MVLVVPSRATMMVGARLGHSWSRITSFGGSVEIQIQYMKLSDIKGAARNPKKHQISDIQSSIKRFGYVEPMVVDERTGRLVAGHGRAASLAGMKERGETPPEGVTVMDGEWQAPVVRGWKSRSDADAEAYILASNQLTIGGGWDETTLRLMLGDLSQQAGALEGVGWSPKELEKLMAASGETEYTKKIDTPIYKPNGDKPKVSELFSATKQAELTAEIDAATEITDEEKAFLRLAAQRHTVFDYQNIAEFYAHAEAPMQRLMEKSALVIVDFNQAIENGFVKMSDDLAAICAQEEQEK